MVRVVDRIKSRIKEDPRYKNRFFLFIFSILVLYNYLAFCFITGVTPFILFPNFPPKDTRVPVRIYYQTPDGYMLKPESHRLMEVDKDPIVNIQWLFGELKAGPDLDNTISPIPSKTILYNVWIVGDMAILNFNKAILDIKDEPKYEYNLVFSIVKTIVANVKQIKRVKFLVNGKEIPTIKGYLNLLEPLTPEDDVYIRRDKL